MQRFGRLGCVMVDTTCGSVLNVWKNVKRYAQDGFTSIIHGKVWHEETQATASQALAPTRRPLSRRAEPRGDRRGVRLHPARRRPRSVPGQFRDAVSPGFDPDRDLQHIGLANQTTMLMSESLQVQELFRQAMRERHGAEALPRASGPSTRSAAPPRIARTPSSPCSRRQPLDLMIVIGGYNSSNTCNLARICAEEVPTFHIADPDCLESADVHPPSAGGWQRVRSGPSGWLPPAGNLTIGLTSGASTPDNLVGTTVDRLSTLCNQTQDDR